LLDRIDLHVAVPRLAPSELRESGPAGEDSATVRARVQAARERQQHRAGRANAHLDAAQTLQHCRLSLNDQRLLEQAIERLQLSARSMHRILRVARSIADLADAGDIQTSHLAEAIGYRQLDRAAGAERAEASPAFG
jgi:Predicted ATPase with chaperone activity